MQDVSLFNQNLDFFVHESTSLFRIPFPNIPD